MSLELGHRLRELRGVSLPQLDRRASLLRRVARKYAIDSDRMLELLERLDRGHEGAGHRWPTLLHISNCLARAGMSLVGHASTDRRQPGGELFALV